MKVTWNEVQEGTHEVTLDGQFFTAGAIIEADTESGVIWYIPALNGCLQIDGSGEWVRRHVVGLVRVYERPVRYATH